MVRQKELLQDFKVITTQEKSDLLALKHWLTQQPHLRTRTDDQFLVQFLRHCQNDKIKTRERLELFYCLKSKYPEMFGMYDVDRPKFREVHNLGCFQVLTRPLYGNGPRLFAINYGFDPHKYTVDDIFLAASAMHELLLLHDPSTRIHGVVYIVDFASASAAHYMQMTPNFAKKLLTYLEKAMPIYIKHAYYINSSMTARNFFKLIIPLMTKSLRKKLTVIGHNMEKLIQHIPLEFLPLEYGGQNGSIQEAAKEYNKIWDLHRDYFKENANYGMDGFLSSGKCMDLDCFFGKNGSYKQLTSEDR